MSTPELLIETFDFVPMPMPLEEKVSPDGRLKVRGRFQYEGIENENKRKYKKGIFEGLRKNPKIARLIERRGMVGHADHPSSGKSAIPEISHVVTDFKVMPNGEVIGEAEILDTPNGKILKTLFEAGILVGISSRGRGSVDKRTGEVQEDYMIDTWDFVVTPSTPDAFPQVLPGKSGNVQESKSVDVTKVLESATKFINETNWENIAPEVVNGVSLSLLEHEVNLLHAKNQDTSIAYLAEELGKQISSKRKTLRESVTLETVDLKESVGGSNQMSTNQTVSVNEALLGQENEQLKLTLQSISEAHDEYAQKYDAAVRVISELQNRYKSLENVAEGLYDQTAAANELIENLVKKLDTIQEDKSPEGEEDVKAYYEAREEAAMKLVNAAVSRLKLSESWNEKLGNRCVAGEKLIEAMVRKVQGSIKEAAIEQVLQNEAEDVAEQLRPELAKCANVMEINEKYEMFQKLVESKTTKAPKNKTLVESKPARKEPLPNKNQMLTEGADAPQAAPVSPALALARRIDRNFQGKL